MMRVLYKKISQLSSWELFVLCGQNLIIPTENRLFYAPTENKHNF